MTDKYCEKFKARSYIKVWPTMERKAWMNEQIMLRYLQFFYEKIANKEPYAFVLDCYKAHYTKNAKQLAKKLLIKLLFVPSNKTCQLNHWIDAFLVY